MHRSPAVEEQAMDRCHRLGQTHEVRVRRFVVQDTVEEKMLEMQASKAMLVSATLNGDDARQERIAALKALFS